MATAVEPGYARLLRRGTAGVITELPDWETFVERYDAAVKRLLCQPELREREPKVLWDWSPSGIAAQRQRWAADMKAAHLRAEVRRTRPPLNDSRGILRRVQSEPRLEVTSARDQTGALAFLTAAAVSASHHGWRAESWTDSRRFPWLMDQSRDHHRCLADG